MTTSMVGLKKNAHISKNLTQMANLRDLAGVAGEKEEVCRNSEQSMIPVSLANDASGKPHQYIC